MIYFSQKQLAALNEVALSYHRVHGLYFLAFVFGVKYSFTRYYYHGLLKSNYLILQMLQVILNESYLLSRVAGSLSLSVESLPSG